MLNRKNIVKLLGIGGLCLVLSGCAEESFIVQEESSTIVLEEVVAEEVSEDSKANVQNAADAVEVKSSETAGEIAVHICGAVHQPGVYYLKENQRLYEGIQKAGGFREDADQDYLNQAMVLEDGMKVVVPTKEEVTARKIAEESEAEVIQSGNFSKAAAMEEGYIQNENSESVSSTEDQNDKVDLNTADEAMLCTLPGIGESRAKSIIAYRQEHGPFQKTEDVMKVSGIKESAYNKIKDYVIVSK